MADECTLRATNDGADTRDTIAVIGTVAAIAAQHPPIQVHVASLGDVECVPCVACA